MKTENIYNLSEEEITEKLKKVHHDLTVANSFYLFNKKCFDKKFTDVYNNQRYKSFMFFLSKSVKQTFFYSINKLFHKKEKNSFIQLTILLRMLEKITKKEHEIFLKIIVEHKETIKNINTIRNNIAHTYNSKQKKEVSIEAVDKLFEDIVNWWGRIQVNLQKGNIVQSYFSNVNNIENTMFDLLNLSQFTPTEYQVFLNLHKDKLKQEGEYFMKKYLNEKEEIFNFKKHEKNTKPKS